MKYLKGLASSSKFEVKDVFGKKIAEYQYDEQAKMNMEKAFAKQLANLRKEWIANASFDVRNPIRWNGDTTERRPLSISDFVNTELIKYSLDNCGRSLPNVIDSLKESQRKALWVAIKTGLFFHKESRKLAQMSARTAELSGYHHGEAILADTIARMAQVFAGSNNVALFYPDGQF